MAWKGWTLGSTDICSKKDKRYKLCRKRISHYSKWNFIHFYKGHLYLPSNNFFNVTKHGISVFPVTDTLQ